VEINGKKIIDYIFDALSYIKNVDKINIITNNCFLKLFERWQLNYKNNDKIVLLNDCADTREQRVGAVGGIQSVIDQCNLSTDILVIGGDNLFDFNLQPFVEFFLKTGISLLVYDVKDVRIARKYSVVKVNEKYEIIQLVEKPIKPLSSTVTPCIYGFPKNTISVISEYLENGNDKDSLGGFMEWLLQRQPIYGYPVHGKWIDVGDEESLERANKTFYQ